MKLLALPLLCIAAFAGDPVTVISNETSHGHSESTFTVMAKATRPELPQLAQATAPSTATITTTVTATPKVEAPSIGIVPQRSIRVSVSRQPLSVFIAVLGSKLPAVAGFSTTACSRLDAPVSFSGGMLRQLIEEHGVPVVDYQAAKISADAARRNSPRYKQAAFISEMAFDVSLAFASNIIVANPATRAGKLVRVLPILVNHKAESIKDSLGSELPPAETLLAGRSLSDEQITLEPGRCVTKLFLGGYSKDITSFTGDLQIQ
jgi:hypothetical protein